MMDRRIAPTVITAEAAMLLLVARLAIRWLPFRRLERIMRRPPSWHAASDRERTVAIAAVQRAIRRGAGWLPGDTVCFPRAVAAQVMLRNRGVASTLCYGARSLPDLKAHAWLTCGSDGVVGNNAAQGYHLLRRYGREETPQAELVAG